MKAFLAALIVVPCLAQKLFVYSEFTRIDPFGQVVAVDRGAEPRHILSPGVPRNAFSSFRVVVELDTPGPFFLDIAQNPEDTFKSTLYRERFEQHGKSWLPDKLDRVAIPYRGTATDFAIPGQKVVTFWLDVWTPRSTPVDRVKLEPQLWLPGMNDWVTYPMEVRVLTPIAPGIKFVPMALPAVTDRSDAALKPLFCTPTPQHTTEPTARSMIQRNAQHHLAMIGRPALKTLLPKYATDPCSEQVSTGPEWYLRFRDAIFRSIHSE